MAAIGVGGIIDPFFADQIVRSGRVDLVAMGRPLLRDPGWFVRAVEALEKTTYPLA